MPERVAGAAGRQRLFAQLTAGDEARQQRVQGPPVTPETVAISALVASGRSSAARSATPDGRQRRCCCPGFSPAPGETPLAQALQEYGRLIKTNFVLAWLIDEELRQRVGRQLNKGEQLHALRRHLFYANEAHVRHRTPEQQAEQALLWGLRRW